MIGEVQLADSHIELEIVVEAYRWAAVRELHNLAVELVRLNTSDRIFAGQVCCHWIATKIITVSDYLRALREFFDLVGELSLDIPNIYQYIAECVGKFQMRYSVSVINFLRIISRSLQLHC